MRQAGNFLRKKGFQVELCSRQKLEAFLAKKKKQTDWQDRLFLNG